VKAIKNLAEKMLGMVVSEQKVGACVPRECCNTGCSQWRGYAYNCWGQCVKSCCS
jgi:hypothetical protein